MYYFVPALVSFLLYLTLKLLCSTDHITEDKLDKVLAVLQGANQKALLMYANSISHYLHSSVT